ncbi:MAG TPA: argininosuccinate lyase [Vicinamibacterales bacterium]|nr:argininosuccinate lyase [Vicinamibacterales bacterium]
MRFDPEYVSQVLNENFEDAKTLFLAPLMAIHSAHLVMLADCRIIGADDARTLRQALDAIPVNEIRRAPYDGTCEDLFFFVERMLVDACGEDVAGRLHTARSRNDIDMTMYRMRQREFVLALIEAVIDLREGLIDLASRHRTTLFAAHTHTQPAQPTTIAHYLLAVVEQLERDVRRLRAAYACTNRSPLGACAITGTGFPIDRRLTSDLLGFDEPMGNTYGCIATVDYLLESASATSVLLVGLGRVIQDLLLWCTIEFGYLRLADGFVQCSSIMPQKRNPVALEHARAIGSKALGQAAAITQSVHNTPFGDIVDTEDDLQPLVASMFRDALRSVTLVDAAMRTAEFDAVRLEARAAEGGTTLTELADHLVRERGIPFKTAHAIVSRVMAALRERPGAALGDTLAAESEAVLGTPLHYSDDEIAGIMSPRHFVDVRRTCGGPAPSETSRALDDARRTLDADRQWSSRIRDALDAAELRLRERVRSL